VKYRVVFTQTAETDLQETVDYIFRVLGNRQAAERFLEELDQQIEQISHHPETHPFVSDDHLRRQGIRLFTIGNYLGFYRIRNDEKTVTILRVLYGRRDWVTLLDREDQ
jgi:toxin ParE1/3/4